MEPSKGIPDNTPPTIGKNAIVHPNVTDTINGIQYLNLTMVLIRRSKKEIHNINAIIVV